MLKLSKLLLTAAGLSLATGLAYADVRYDFTATSSDPFEGISYTGSFSLVTPDFIRAETWIPVATLAQCSAATAAGPVPCSDSTFLFDVSEGYDTVAFGVRVSDTVNLRIFYYFTDGAFSTPGLHMSQLLGPDQAATLTVSSLSPVPEMASWAYASLGLAGLLVMVRRPKQKQS